MEIDFNEMSSKVECIKIAMTQDKNGYVLKLSINPTDAPEDLLRDLVGQRYLAVFVRLDDEDKPVASPTTEEGSRAVKIAGTLCNDSNFQTWLCINGESEEMSEVAASIALRRLLGVTSRAELKSDAKARRKLHDLRTEFIHWLEHGQR